MWILTDTTYSDISDYQELIEPSATYRRLYDA